LQNKLDKQTVKYHLNNITKTENNQTFAEKHLCWNMKVE